MKLFICRSASWTILALCLVFATAASASTIGPGQTAPPDPLTGAGDAQLLLGGSVLASTSGTFSGIDALGHTRFTGNYTEKVIASAPGFNSFCVGCLDFVYAFANTGAAGTIERSTTVDYTGFLTDVGVDSSNSYVGSIVGALPPISVDRSGDGSTVGFQFSLVPPLGVPPGSHTLDLVIETNALGFTAGAISFIDGGTANVAGFAPTGPIGSPEPASLALMGTGIVFCARLLRRKKKTAEAAVTA